MTESHITFKVMSNTHVLVSDKNLALHQHVMHHDRVFRADTRLRAGGNALTFAGIKRSHRVSVSDLASHSMGVFVTGHSKWPYLIIDMKHLQTVTPTNTIDSDDNDSEFLEWDHKSNWYWEQDD